MVEITQALEIGIQGQDRIIAVADLLPGVLAETHGQDGVDAFLREWVAETGADVVRLDEPQRIDGACVFTARFSDEFRALCWKWGVDLDALGGGI